MTTMRQELAQIENIVKSERLISTRIAKLEAAGFHVEELPMGSGGVLQRRNMRDGTARIQIGYGHGRNNYAMVVIMEHHIPSR